jgi:hypothetical protein
MAKHAFPKLKLWKQRFFLFSTLRQEAYLYPGERELSSFPKDVAGVNTSENDAYISG